MVTNDNALGQKGLVMKNEQLQKMRQEAGRVSPMSDNQVRERYPHLADYLDSWRKLARFLDYSGPVAWLFGQGFELRQFEEILSHFDCFCGFEDVATESDVLVFWVPRLADNSRGKNISEMIAHRETLRDLFGLPRTHAKTFGDVRILAALIITHYLLSGERVPHDFMYAATDDMSDEFRLIVGCFNEGGLCCDFWNDDAFGFAGFFLIGVEKV